MERSEFEFGGKLCEPDCCARAQVPANAEDADMSGYLKLWKGNKWKKLWFVLKGKALFTYKASEVSNVKTFVPDCLF